MIVKEKKILFSRIRLKFENSETFPKNRKDLDQHV